MDKPYNEKRETSDPRIALQHILDSFFRGKENIQVLEAGCGSSSHINFPLSSYLVGIDISARQLERNGSLHERVLGDIQTHELPHARFDVVVCWDVLEHVPNPGQAMENFSHAIKEDALIILAVPNVLSLKGLVTKFSPHWFHVWVYRRILGNREAGKEDRGPFRTYLKFSIAPSAVVRFAKKHSLSVEFLRSYESPMQETIRGKSKTLDIVFRALKWPIKVLTLGYVEVDQSDCIMVLKKTTREPEPV